MKIILADIQTANGSVRKEAGGGYGERLKPFSPAARLAHRLTEPPEDLPSPILATLAALLVDAGHDVAWTREEIPKGDVAIVRSSLVDYRNETRWATEARASGLRVGFVGVAAWKMPELFAQAADFVIHGEPEEVVLRIAQGERIEGLIASEPIRDPSRLPPPRWDLAGVTGRRGARLPLLTHRGAGEFCAGCPHAVLAPRRARSVASLVEELAENCRRYDRPVIAILDPLFTEEPEHVRALCDAIRQRDLRLRLECEVRPDRLEIGLLEALSGIGLEALTLCEPCDEAPRVRDTERERELLGRCDERGIRTIGNYVLGGLSETWDSTAATIDRAIERGTMLARFRLLTPHPGTMTWARLQPQIVEEDWERFDGFTPTFRHPSLTSGELEFLLAAAHARFYLRPSFLTRLWRLDRGWLRGLVDRLDLAAGAWHSRRERATMSRTVEIEIARDDLRDR